MRSGGGSWRSWLGFLLAWIIAAALAVTVGVVAVSRLGAEVRDRGPQGDSTMLRTYGDAAGSPTLDPQAERVEKTFDGSYGSFTAACQGRFALGLEARPAAGWRVVSYESGPDDDIDVVFSDGSASQELEIYCNLGEPVLGEVEHLTLPEADDKGDDKAEDRADPDESDDD